MKHIHGILGLCFLSALITGCATTLPVQEVRQVSAAYDAAAAAGGPLLDELAIAERRGELRVPPADLDPFTADGLTVFRSFNPDLASSFASIGEPRRTAAQRRGLKVVGAYIDVLVILAEGKNIDEAKARIQILATNVAGLAGLFTGGISTVAAPVVKALDPIIERAARAQNAEELRRIVLEGEKPIDELLVSLIDSSREIYILLIDESRTAATRTHTQNKPAQRAEMLKIAAYHVETLNYVVLLRQLRVTFAALATVVREPSPVTLASLNASSNELLLTSESVRRAYAIFRRPSAANVALEVTQ